MPAFLLCPPHFMPPLQVQCIAAVRAYLALMDAAQVPYDPSLRPLQRRLLEGLRTLTAVGAVAVDALGPMKVL